MQHPFGAPLVRDELWAPAASPVVSSAWRTFGERLPRGAWRDADAEHDAEALLTPHTAPHRLTTVRGDAFSAGIGFSRVGSLTVIEQRYRGLGAIAVTAPSPVFTVTIPLRGSLAVTLEGSTSMAAQGSPVVFDAGVTPLLRGAAAADFLTFALPPDFLPSYARRHLPWLDLSEPIRFPAVAGRRADAVAAAAWRIAVRARTAEPGGGEDPADLLAAALLLDRPHSHSRAALRSGAVATDAAVWEAAALLHSAPEARTGIADLARTLGMSVRSLQVGFHRVFGLSPSQFQRDARLDLGRSMLRAAPLTVAEVSEMVGYVHPGRFARDFRRRFGVPPSRARRRSQDARL